MKMQIQLIIIIIIKKKYYYYITAGLKPCLPPVVGSVTVYTAPITCPFLSSMVQVYLPALSAVMGRLMLTLILPGPGLKLRGLPLLFWWDHPTFSTWDIPEYLQDMYSEEDVDEGLTSTRR